MKKFKKPFLTEIYLEVEVSDEELKEIRDDVMEDIGDEIDEYTEGEIEDMIQDTLDDLLWDKFHDAKKDYEVKNHKTLIDTEDWDVEEV